MKTTLGLLLGLLSATGCATRYTRWTLDTRPGPEPLVQADSVARSLGYALAAAPPTRNPAARANARVAWIQWLDQGGAAAVPPPYGPRHRDAYWFWVRPRADGGWDQLAVITEPTRWGSAEHSAAPYWNRLVVHGGTFAPDGREHRPTARVRAEVDSIVSVVRNAMRDPVTALGASRVPERRSH